MTVIYQRDTLSEQTIQDVFLHIEAVKNQFVWNSNLMFWDKGLINSNGVVMTHKLNPVLAKKIMDELHQRQKLPYVPTGYVVLFYAWYAGSNITWHRDYEDKNSMTIYLNKDWKSDDGGWFCWCDWEAHYTKEQNKTIRPDECMSRKPLYNHSVFMTGAEWHCTTSTPPAAPVRYTLQMFFEKPTA